MRRPRGWRRSKRPTVTPTSRQTPALYGYRSFREGDTITLLVSVSDGVSVSCPDGWTQVSPGHFEKTIVP